MKNNILKKLAILGLLLIPLLMVQKSIDNDAWFMMNHGRYLLENGFPDFEPFTLHEGFHFNLEKWASCVTYWLVYSNFGKYGIMALLYLVATVIILLFYNFSYMTSKNRKISIISTIVSLSMFCLGFIRSRPQIFSYIIMLIEVTLLEKYRHSNNKKYLFALPLLAIAYMQFHSTMWPVFFIMMLPYIFDFKDNVFKTKNLEPEYRVPLVVCFLICLASGVINPYGFGTIEYIFNELTSKWSVSITELQTMDIYNFWIYGIIFPHLFFYIFMKDIRIPLRYVWFNIGTFIMGATAIRNESFYILFGGMSTAYMFRNIQLNINKPKQVYAICSLILIGICLNLFKPIDDGEFFSRTYAKTTLDNFVEQYGTGQRMWTSFHEGAYAEFKGIKAYFDPRVEVFVPKVNGKEDITKEFIDFKSGKITWRELQDKYDFDYWLIDNNFVFKLYMDKDPMFHEVLSDDLYTIYEVK